MTESDAHYFLAKCSRWWVGQGPMPENETIRKTKSICLVLMLQAVVLITLELPRLVFSVESQITGWFYVRIAVVVFGFLSFGVSFWVLMRVRRACQVLGKNLKGGI